MEKKVLQQPGKKSTLVCCHTALRPLWGDRIPSRASSSHYDVSGACLPSDVSALIKSWEWKNLLWGKLFYFFFWWMFNKATWAVSISTGRSNLSSITLRCISTRSFRSHSHGECRCGTWLNKTLHSSEHELFRDCSSKTRWILLWDVSDNAHLWDAGGSLGYSPTFRPSREPLTSRLRLIQLPLKNCSTHRVPAFLRCACEVLQYLGQRSVKQQHTLPRSVSNCLF